jgi:osmoprotectant transport system substrate-binding protein
VLSVTLTSLVLIAAACGDDDDEESSSSEPAATEPSATDPATTEGGDAGAVPDGPTIVIGAQDFGESAILAEIYGQALADAGYPVEQQALGGFRDLVFTAFDSGDINFTPEYAASALEFLNGDETEASGDIEPTVEALRARLAELGLQALEPAPAVDSNSFVVTAETAEELGLSAVSDLTDDLTLGGPPDCPENSFCIPGLIETYGIDLSANFVPLDGGGPLTVEALDGGEIDVAILFSTNGVIADRGWVVLDDDQGLINADNVVPVVTDEVAAAYGADMVALVDAVSAALSTEELTELNRQFDIDKVDADEVARTWLESEGLIGA